MVYRGPRFSRGHLLYHDSSFGLDLSSISAFLSNISSDNVSSFSLVRVKV